MVAVSSHYLDKYICIFVKGDNSTMLCSYAAWKKNGAIKETMLHTVSDYKKWSYKKQR